MTLDKEIKTVVNDVPADFLEALKAAGLSEFFAGCTNAHRKEYLRWIGEAKRTETTKVRIGKAMKMLSDKQAEETARAKKRTRRDGSASSGP